MSDRLSIVKAGLAGHTMKGLARELGVSRQMLYKVLKVDPHYRSGSVEEKLSEMFPDLPDWPPREGDPTGAIPLDEWEP